MIIIRWFKNVNKHKTLIIIIGLFVLFSFHPLLQPFLPLFIWCLVAKSMYSELKKRNWYRFRIIFILYITGFACRYWFNVSVFWGYLVLLLIIMFKKGMLIHPIKTIDYIFTGMNYMINERAINIQYGMFAKPPYNMTKDQIKQLLEDTKFYRYSKKLNDKLERYEMEGIRYELFKRNTQNSL